LGHFLQIDEGKRGRDHDTFRVPALKTIYERRFRMKENRGKQDENLRKELVHAVKILIGEYTPRLRGLNWGERLAP